MQVRIINLDDSLPAQEWVGKKDELPVHDLRRWGPRLRIACGFDPFTRFEAELAEQFQSREETEGVFTFFGSGDFHHVSLALLHRQPAPFNLLMIDKHPDWMRAIPFLHCGTWLYHAGRLPNLKTIFHVGGDLDFDNRYRPLAPWPWLRTGKIVTFPAIRRFQGKAWSKVYCIPLRPEPEIPLDQRRLESLLSPHATELASRPLYISVDKDALTAREAAVNWDSGHLNLDELNVLLSGFINAAGGRLAGGDTTGDWSPVKLEGWFRQAFHLAEHPRLKIDAAEARVRNQRINLAILERIEHFQPQPHQAVN